MLIAFMNYFTKFTGWLPEQMVLRPKVLFENKKVQRRRIKGAAIIISDHHSVYDYLAYMFVFFWRTLRFQMAEVLFKRKGLSRFLRALGGIYVDRDSHDFPCLTKSEAILRRGGVVGIFPEGTRNKENDEILPFKAGSFKIATKSGCDIIPISIVNTSAIFEDNFPKIKKAHVIIEYGKPIPTAGLPREELVALPGKSRDLIVEMYERNKSSLIPQNKKEV